MTDNSIVNLQAALDGLERAVERVRAAIEPEPPSEPEPPRYIFENEVGRAKVQADDSVFWASDASGKRLTFTPLQWAQGEESGVIVRVEET